MNKPAIIMALAVLSGLGWLASLKNKALPTRQTSTTPIPEMVDKALAATRHVGTGGTAVVTMTLAWDHSQAGQPWIGFNVYSNKVLGKWYWLGYTTNLFWKVTNNLSACFFTVRTTNKETFQVSL